MSKLTLKFPVATIKPIVEIDGENIPFKLTNFNTYECTAEVENESKIRIFSLKNELDSKWWFLKFLGYYIVSFFGIFDSGFGKNYYSFDYNGKIKVEKDTTISFFFAKREEGKKVLVVAENVDNCFETDKKTFKLGRLFGGKKERTSGGKSTKIDFFSKDTNQFEQAFLREKAKYENAKTDESFDNENNNYGQNDAFGELNKCYDKSKITLDNSDGEKDIYINNLEETIFEDNKTNIYQYNKKLGKRNKTTIIFKILSWVIITIITIATMV